MNILAIIPARGGSKRIPGKNIKPLLGKPLIHWTIEFALGSGLFADVCVSTDDDEIARVSESAGLRVPHRRPAEWASDTATSVDMALYECNRWSSEHGREPDAVALLQPTSPVRTHADWSQAVARLDASPDCPAVVGVCAVQEHPAHMFYLNGQQTLSPLLGDVDLKQRTQDLSALYRVNGALYLIRTEVLKQARSFFPAGTQAVVCEGLEASIDLDTPQDWRMAECLLQTLNR